MHGVAIRASVLLVDLRRELLRVHTLGLGRGGVERKRRKAESKEEGGGWHHEGDRGPPHCPQTRARTTVQYESIPLLSLLVAAQLSDGSDTPLGTERLKSQNARQKDPLLAPLHQNSCSRARRAAVGKALPVRAPGLGALWT